MVFFRVRPHVPDASRSMVETYPLSLKSNVSVSPTYNPGFKKSSKQISVYIFYHPSTAIRKRPLHPFISFTIHPPIVILKTAITSIHLIHHPSTTILKRLLHPSISFTINPSKIQKNHNFFYFFEISSIHCNL